MDRTPAGSATAADRAKGALRRLAQSRQEPTPENYARAYAEESGQPAVQPDAVLPGAAWAQLIERLAKGLSNPGRQWTLARRRDSLKRVLDGSRSDAQRMHKRLQSLMSAWEEDRADEPVESGAADVQAADGIGDATVDAAVDSAVNAAAASVALAASDAGLAWPPLVAVLEGTVRAGLPTDDLRATELADRLAVLADAVARDGATPAHGAQIEIVCSAVRRLFSHRHELVEQLGDLCRELTLGLTELAEDPSWARGQCQALQVRLQAGVSVRGVRSAAELLADTRQRQRALQAERHAARDALKGLLNRMLGEVDELGAQTGRFHQAVAGHATAIAGADSLESLATVVTAMLQDSRDVQSAVDKSQQRLQQDRDRATGLEQRVRDLEAELRRLSDEVCTDALTQVANRRGLATAFAAEQARTERAGHEAAPLAVALMDVDNFKKLNDSLGHAAGDVALKSLAAAVRERLRPVDHLARFGGEEFVVLMPGTALEEAQHALSRLQRALTASLFMHDGEDVFVTFSAGVTVWRAGETLETSLSRADEALYEAKRTGKNRTCTA
jgi:diguanylate cyclase